MPAGAWRLASRGLARRSSVRGSSSAREGKKKDFFKAAACRRGSAARGGWGVARPRLRASGVYTLHSFCGSAARLSLWLRHAGVARPRVWVSGVARPCATKLLRLCREAVAVALPRAQVSAGRTLYYTAAYNIYIYIYICIWGSATRPSPRLRHARGVWRGACCVYSSFVALPRCCRGGSATHRALPHCI